MYKIYASFLVMVFTLAVSSTPLALSGPGRSASRKQNSYPLWKIIKAGSYNVGFRTINWRDTTRSLTDSDKNDAQNTGFLPVQISVWYPTNARWSCAKSMPFKNYFYLAEQKNDFKELSQERKDKAMDIFYNFAKFGLSVELNSDQLKAIGDTCTASIKDADAIRQKFPVVLAGHDGGVWKISTLSEYLASHGYVVVSTGFLSSTFSMMSKEPQKALMMRLRTFEVTKRLLETMEFADSSRIGLLGLNADGMSVLLYQMKNRQAKALVSIDGWEGKNGGSRYTSENIHFELAGLNTPYLEFQQDDNTDREHLQLNTSIFKQMTHSDRFSYVQKDFGHAYLTGNMIALPKLSEQAIEQHIFWYSAVLNFFDAYVKRVDSAHKYIWQQDKHLGFNPTLLKRAERIRSNED